MLIGPGKGVSWTEESIPFLLELSDQAVPFNIPFDKIRENLLDLEPGLANTILRLDLRVDLLNRTIIQEKTTISSLARNSKTGYHDILSRLEVNKQINAALLESIKLLAQTGIKARQQLFAGNKKLVVDWSSVDKQFKEVEKRLAESVGISSD